MPFIKALLLALFIAYPALCSNQLPDIGTAGVTALPVAQEVRFGQAYMRVIRASLPMLYDPVLDEYISQLGHRLVSNADSVRTPFNFFLIRDNEINAAAFLGGNVKVHTGLFLYAENEDELASVLAHEIVHITQRHLARTMEEQAKGQSMTIASLVGAILLGIANPIAGIAAFQGTLAMNMQSNINYTRSNEYEADRLGMKILAQSSFDPEGMSNFFGKLAAKYRFASTPPQMLLTHPLPDARVAEARSRAHQYPHRYYPPSLAFGLAKSRIIVRYSEQPAESSLQFFNSQLENKNYKIKSAALYGKALALLALGKTEEANEIVTQLAKEYPENLFFIDTLSDIDQALNETDRAIKRLETYNKVFINNSVITINLAHLYSVKQEHKKSATLLDLFVRQHPESTLAWTMLVDEYQALGNISRLHAATAEVFALKADYKHALDEIQTALRAENSKQSRELLEARSIQLNAEKIQFDALLE